MTERHYSWVKDKIRTEVRGTHGSSIWAALSLSMVGVLAALVIVITSTPRLGAGTKAGYREAAWFIGIIALTFLMFHVVIRRGANDRAEELIAEMDLHVTHRAVLSETSDAAPAAKAETPLPRIRWIPRNVVRSSDVERE